MQEEKFLGNLNLTGRRANAVSWSLERPIGGGGGIGVLVGGDLKGEGDS